jgi:uncharacterized protein (DUF2141 family)
MTDQSNPFLPTSGVPPAAAVGTIAICSLTVYVMGLRSRKGQVCFSLYANEAGFPSERGSALASQFVALAGTGPAAARFEKLVPGTYAVAAFHDENGDGVLNCNILGMPREGFGFSANPRILMGPPRFSEAAIRVAGPMTKIEIQLKHFGL